MMDSDQDEEIGEEEMVQEVTIAMSKMMGIDKGKDIVNHVQDFSLVPCPSNSNGQQAPGTTLMMEIDNPVEKIKWGPVQAIRKSNIFKEDGKTIIQKAQELQQLKNLEGTRVKGTNPNYFNSFATLENEKLLEKTNAVGISLGNDLQESI